MVDSQLDFFLCFPFVGGEGLGVFLLTENEGVAFG